MMELFDTHAHLLDERFDADREALLAALPAAGIRYVLEACCDEAGFDVVAALSESYPFLYASAGVHPHSASERTKETAAHLSLALAHPRCVAAGEIGLE